MVKFKYLSRVIYLGFLFKNYGGKWIKNGAERVMLLGACNIVIKLSLVPKYFTIPCASWS